MCILSFVGRLSSLGGKCSVHCKEVVSFVSGSVKSLYPYDVKILKKQLVV